MRRPAAGLLGLVLAIALAEPSRAQGFGMVGSQSAVGTPSFGANGVWAQVVSVTPKWLVLQTADRRQFPVSFQAVGLFAIRWPTSPALLAPDAWAEVTGLDVGGNQVVAAQVDVYEGAARNLVSPVSQTIVGYNRVISQNNPFTLGTFNYFNLLPGEEMMPRRRHVVGPLVSRNPLAIAVAGNAAVAILPTGAGLTVNQVTPGSSSFVRPGDLAFFIPNGYNARTLALGQLVLYKGIPLNQFVP